MNVLVSHGRGKNMYRKIFDIFLFSFSILFDNLNLRQSVPIYIISYIVYIVSLYESMHFFQCIYAHLYFRKRLLGKKSAKKSVIPGAPGRKISSFESIENEKFKFGGEL